MFVAGSRLRLISASLASLLLYLLFWPVPIAPVAWDAPQDMGLVDPYAPNDRLQRMRLIELRNHSGPEDIAAGPDGQIYTATNDGNVLKLSTNGDNVAVFAHVGGRPLGLEFNAAGELIIANAYVGLQIVRQDGRVEILVDEFEGEKIKYADDVAVAADGIVYFSDASSKHGAKESGGSYESSLVDILEHGGHGRVFRFDPLTNEIALVLDGLNFANGVAISENQQYLLINETGSYRVLRYWLQGPRKGESEIVIDNLPGFPDNINNGRSGKFWVGLVAPRNALLDKLSSKPWLRKIVQRLPAAFRPSAEASSHVIAITGDGEILMSLQDSTAELSALTGVYESPDALWLSSLFGHYVGRLAKADLAN